MRDEVAQQPRAIRIIFAPTEEVIGIERNLFIDRAEPLLPIHRVACSSIIYGIVPLALRVVATVIALRPNERADLAALNQFGGLVPTGGGTALRTDLEDLARLFDHIMDLKRLAEVAGHGLFAINMLSSIQRINGNRRVHWVMGGNHHRVNVLLLEQLWIMVVGLAITTDEFFGGIYSLLKHVTNGSEGNIVFSGVRFDLAHVRIEALAANADKANGDAIVCAGNIGRRCLALAINGAFDQPGAGDGSRDRSGLLNELPARKFLR